MRLASDDRVGVRHATELREDVEALVRSAKVLIVDDEYYMRKVIRTLLLTIGVHRHP